MKKIKMFVFIFIVACSNEATQLPAQEPSAQGADGTANTGTDDDAGTSTTVGTSTTAGATTTTTGTTGTKTTGTTGTKTTGTTGTKTTGTTTTTSGTSGEGTGTGSTQKWTIEQINFMTTNCKNSSKIVVSSGDKAAACQCYVNKMAAQFTFAGVATASTTAINAARTACKLSPM